LLRTVGAEAVRLAVAGSLSPLEFKIRMLEAEFGVGSEDFWKLAIEAVRVEPSALEQARLIDYLSPKYPKIRDVAAAKRALQRTIEVRGSEQAVVRPKGRNRELDYVQENIAGILHPLEVSLFGAILNEEFRSEAWPFILEGELLLTQAGRTLAEKLSESFPDGPPSGLPRVWIEQVGSKGAKEVLEAVSRDSRVHVNREFFDDTIYRLRAKADRRELEELKTQEGDDRLTLIQLNLSKPSSRTQ